MIARRLPPDGGAGGADGAGATAATLAGAGDDVGDDLAAAEGELMIRTFFSFLQRTAAPLLNATVGCIR